MERGLIQTLRKFINNEKYGRVMKFGITGCANTAVDFMVYSLLVFSGINYSFSQIAGYSCGTINSYILNKYWTFGDRSKNKKDIREIVKFIAVNLISLIISILGLKVLIGQFGLNPYISKVFVILLTQLVNYLGYKLWVF